MLHDRNIAKSPARVLIVDDSATMRMVIKKILQADPDIEVVGTAGDAFEAREAIKALNPDVVTLDVEMPRMDGLAFLRKIMALRPMPVVMVSTLTDRGAKCAVEAMMIGAVECVGKPVGGDLQSGMSRLPQIVKNAARATIKPRPVKIEPAQKPKSQPSFDPGNNIIAIGSSTGGVEALSEVLSHWPANCPPTLIVQHMPAQFTPSFAARLNQQSAASVVEAYDGAPLQQGKVYLAPGGDRHLTLDTNSTLKCRVKKGDLVNGHSPSVDVLFDSLLSISNRITGIILTGLGNDGAKGLKRIRDAGASTIGQDEASSTVYGMPRAAFEAGAVERQLPLERIGTATLDLCTKRRR